MYVEVHLKEMRRELPLPIPFIHNASILIPVLAIIGTSLIPGLVIALLFLLLLPLIYSMISHET